MNKNIMSKLGFADAVELIEQGKCPFCSELIKQEDFTSELSKKEFRISGLCQKCQNDFFGSTEQTELKPTDDMNDYAKNISMNWARKIMFEYSIADILTFEQFVKTMEKVVGGEMPEELKPKMEKQHTRVLELKVLQEVTPPEMFEKAFKLVEDVFKKS